jgi:hypothetical protein
MLYALGSSQEPKGAAGFAGATGSPTGAYVRLDETSKALIFGSLVSCSLRRGSLSTAHTMNRPPTTVI